jgi:hypothetical protein
MPLILPGNVGSATAATGYDVANSCRFNDGSSDSLNKTPSSNGTRTTWTFSIWLKRSSTSTSGHQIFDASPTPGSDESKIYFYNDFLYWKQEIGGGGADGYLVTNRKFRDVSAWYNIICQWNTTSGTESERMKIFVNGVQETSFSTANYPDQNRVSYINSTNNHYIGSSGGSASFFDGYMTEIVFVDGTALDQTSFGEFDEDSPTIWKPKDVSGLTFGTNGFYLDFEDSSALGNDAAGSNNFTVNNLTAIDQSTDTCTNNFATLNPLVYGNSPTLSEGNLKFSSSDANWRASVSTIGFTQGKWYAEFKLDSANDYVNTGIATMSHFQQTTNVKIGYTSTSYGYDANNGNYYVGDSATSYGASLSSGDILGVALDLDNNKLYFSKNGTFQNSGNPASGSTGTGAISITSGLEYFIATSAYGSGKGASANFGSPSFSISSGNSDANGYGNFEYSVPSGYYSINTKNLAEFG